MDAKKIGIIVLVVAALGILIFSVKSNFAGGPGAAPPEAGKAMAEKMKAQATQRPGPPGAPPRSTQ